MKEKLKELKDWFPSLLSYKWQEKKVPEWKKKQSELKLRAKIAKKENLLWVSWVSIGKTGFGVTYERAKHGELVHGLRLVERVGR